MYVDLETCTIGGFYSLIKLRPAERIFAEEEEVGPASRRISSGLGC
jgi:hypothetical protein